jgi:aminodeoxyfutalosine synthase
MQNTMTSLDSYMDRIERGERLTPDEIRELASTPDILSVGMLADTVRRRRHGARVTFLRLAEIPCDGSIGTAVPPAAREVRLTGSPSIDDAISSIETMRASAGDRTVAGFSWIDVERWSAGPSSGQVLTRLKKAGLDAISELPLDSMQNPAASITALRDAGFDRLRLTINKAPADSRVDLLLEAAGLQDAMGAIQSINPLPMALATFRPTTGYEDVKMVALARLAAMSVPSIQVDWRRYGPKLAQVALTFGADDIDGVSASDDAPEGRRRAPRAEIERNIQVAGFTPAERDGRFNLL